MKSIPSDWKKVGVICLLFFMLFCLLQSYWNFSRHSMCFAWLSLLSRLIPYYIYVCDMFGLGSSYVPLVFILMKRVYILPNKKVN